VRHSFIQTAAPISVVILASNIYLYEIGPHRPHMKFQRKQQGKLGKLNAFRFKDLRNYIMHHSPLTIRYLLWKVVNALNRPQYNQMSPTHQILYPPVACPSEDLTSSASATHHPRTLSTHNNPTTITPTPTKAPTTFPPILPPEF
jgi:hypothetical protein